MEVVMSYPQFIFCMFSGGLLLAIGLLTTTLLSTSWFFIAIGGCLCILSGIQFRRSASALVILTKPKSLVQQK
jgi:hypothetical protein